MEELVQCGRTREGTGKIGAQALLLGRQFISSDAISHINVVKSRTGEQSAWRSKAICGEMEILHTKTRVFFYLLFCDSLLGHCDTDQQQQSDSSLHPGMSAANQSWNIIELEGHVGLVTEYLTC